MYTYNIANHNISGTHSTRPHFITLRHLSLLALLTLFFGVNQALGQAVIMNGNYYLTHNEAGNNINSTATTSFNPSTCLWVYVSRDYIRTANSNGVAISNNNNYLQYSSLSLNGDWGNWYRGGNNESVYHRVSTGWGWNSSYSYYYLRLDGTTWRIDGTDRNNGVLYDATITTQGPTDNTTSTISVASISGNTITFSHSDLTGTYIPQYTRYVFNSKTHNWYNNTDYNGNEPSINANTLSPNYTWSITGANATINAQSGVVTFSGIPSGNYTVTLSITNISPLPNKSIPFNFSAQSVEQGTSYSYSSISITPSSSTLDLEETKTFTVSNTVTETASVTPAHTKVTIGGTDYYYYNNSLNNTPPSSTTSNTTLSLSSVNWADGGGGGYYTLSTYYSDSNNNTTLTRTSLKSDTDRNYTITATANYGGKSQNLTASATVTIPFTYVDIADISCSGVTMPFGETRTLEPNTWINGTGAKYVNITYTVADGTIASVDENGVVTALKVGSTEVTLQTIKINGSNGPSVTASITVTPASLPAPTITLDNNTGVATLTDNSNISGATIRYTTDGTTPTSSTATTIASGGTVTLTRGQTIMAIVTVDGGNYTPSPIATDIYVETGAFGSTVYLDDREDHNWSYYHSASDLPDGYPTEHLSSPDPRNVKITYRGGSVSGASEVAISALDAEGQNEMVYFKTLEKTVLGMTGNYPYTVISNPFSKRPRTTGSTDNNGFYGFAGWKVISGGEYISEYNNNQTLPLDATIHFTNLNNNYTPNCTSGEVVFEATWTEATVKTGNSAQSFSGGNYETNFWVLSGNSDISNITVPANVTVSARFPDGTVNFNRNLTGTITAGGDNAKIEFVNVNSNGNVTAAGNTFTIGRGVVNSGNGGQLSCSNSDKNANHTVKVESGKYASLRHFTNQLNASRSCNQFLILGCDYDRAKTDNSKLTITGEMYLANSATLNRASGVLFVRSNIKSGTFQKTVSDTYSGTAAQSYYFGCYGSNYRSAGHRYMLVEGGDIRGLCGGTDHTTNQKANDPAFTLRVRGSENNPVINGIVYGAAENALCQGRRVLIFTGGTVKGWIAGAANGTSSTNGTLTGETFVYIGGGTQVNSNGSNTVINRAIGGNVFAAGCGYSASSNSGQVTLGTNLVVADESYIERGAYGGGSYGYTTSTSNIFILGGHIGGNNGGVNGTSYSAAITGGVFGGACQNQGGTVNITMTGGIVEGGLYGGSNANGTISGSVTMNINGGQVGTTSQTANIHGGGYGSATVVSGNVDLTLGATSQTEDGVTVYGDVYGGSALGSVNGTSATTTYHTYVTLNKGIINGSLYGGALGDNSTAANVYGPVQVKVYGGSVRKTDANGANGSGGVYGANNIKGAPQRSVTVDIYGTDPAPSADEYALFAVYGGGNKADYTYGNGYPQVTVHKCDNSIEYVYGGGNAAAVAATDVTIYGGDVIGNVFGGGNGISGTAADVTGNASTKIYGGTILRVYGGSNKTGTIGGDITVNVESKVETAGDTLCKMHVDTIFGGGNMAASKAGQISIVCTGKNGYIGNVFGGANAADIDGNIGLKINGGNIGNVFGGNNARGDISGSITVTVGDAPENCGVFQIGNVYGGGNLAPYGHNTDYPSVNIVSGTITQNVYGGGLGTSATVTGNPQVQLTGGAISGYVFGGGDAAPVTGSPVVTASGANTSAARLYGGGKGNTAIVTGNTKVTVTNGTYGYVFGGGDAADMTGSVTVQIKGGTVTNDVYGGGALANTNTANWDNTKNGNKGGWADGKTSASNTTSVELTGGKILGNAYGGGLGQLAQEATAGHEALSAVEAKVYGDVTVLLDGTYLQPQYRYEVNNGKTDTIATGGMLFGCNNANGTPKGTVLVHVKQTVDQNGSNSNKPAKRSAVYEVSAVYGGGNQAAYVPAAADSCTNVIIEGCDETSIMYVYGGGNAASVPATKVKVYGDYEIGYVFGGGNGAGRDNPGANVGYHADVEVAGNTVPGAAYGDGTTNAELFGGTIYHSFGGSNTRGNIRVSSTIKLDEEMDPSYDCCTELILGETYGGGNKAYMNGSSNIILGCIDYLPEIYGGARAADVGSDVVLTITSGRFDRVFGGNNEGGSINGSITVNVEETGCHPIQIGAVFGGGNMAPYVTPQGKEGPTLNILSCTRIDTIFGGGNEASVTGDTHININMVKGVLNSSNTDPNDNVEQQLGKVGYVFGGGNKADVIGDTYVKIGTDENVTFHSLPSGSNQFTTEGVNIENNVYGGGNQAHVTGQTHVQIGPKP